MINQQAHLPLLKATKNHVRITPIMPATAVHEKLTVGNVELPAAISHPGGLRQPLTSGLPRLPVLDPCLSCEALDLSHGNIPSCAANHELKLMACHGG